MLDHSGIGNAGRARQQVYTNDSDQACLTSSTRLALHRRTLVLTDSIVGNDAATPDCAGRRDLSASIQGQELSMHRSSLGDPR